MRVSAHPRFVQNVLNVQVLLIPSTSMCVCGGGHSEWRRAGAARARVVVTSWGYLTDEPLIESYRICISLTIFN